ncbi:acetylxylan esterase precursor [Fusarium pseudoanthophilum]|uniref:Acetylxylan esterase n=1 Tax=Fusarium pseudoanthophilum TaxID=48495 RepID=A0A8H5PRQ1_9HYPO|nr:acetylxylan esterase precursor [Fusarium pseudoanthophilum]
MGSRTSLRSILRGWFATDKYSDTDSEPDVRIESVRGECPLPDRNRQRHKRERNNPFGLPKKRTYCSHCHGTNGYGDNDFSRRVEAKKKRSHKDQHASGGQQHRLSEQSKPLPVVPRQRRPPPARGQRTPSEDTSLQREGHNQKQKHKRSSNVVDTRLNASKQQLNQKKHGIHTIYQQDQDQELDQGSNEAIFLSDDRSMNREAVSEVVDMIAQRFSHIPYAVSGLAAMVYYGYEARPYRVSIVCPEHTRENQKCWARAQGMIPIPRQRHVWGVATSDGILQQIRVRFPYDFNEMHALKIGTAGSLPVSMLSLAGLADELARTYVNELKHSDHDRQENLAHEMIWILRRIIQCRLPEHALRPERIPHLIRETFWLPFTLSYPETVPLFAKAGWSIPDEGWH